MTASLFLPPRTEPRPGVLFIHGLDSDQVGYRQRAAVAAGTLGIACLTFDLSGHGASIGQLDELTPHDHLMDVRAAYDVLAAHPVVDPTRIGVCAASYGGYLAALLIADRPVRRLLLRAPGLYRDDHFERPLRERLRSDADSEPTLATRNLASFSGEVLILESGADETIPGGVIAAYLRACPRARHVTIAGAAHRLVDPAHRQRFQEEILGFFGDM